MQTGQSTDSNERGLIPVAAKRLIITVHGIRTFGNWQERLEQILSPEPENDDIFFVHYKYGYFSVLAFLIPPLRWLVVRNFRQELVHWSKQKTWDRIDVVGHSFGTHLIGWGLASLPSFLKPAIHTIILSGSVLKINFPWRDLTGPNLRRVVNDCGSKDSVLLINQLLVLFTGMAGRVGFSGATHGGFRNRFFVFGHSGYFVDDGGKPIDDWMRQYWLPVLTGDGAVAALDLRPALTPLDGFIHTIANNSEPIKLFVYVTPVALAFFWILGLYTEADIQRKDAIEKRDIALGNANRSRANLAVSIGNQLLESEPSVAMALGLHSLELSSNNSARSLVNRAIRNVPVFDTWNYSPASRNVADSQRGSTNVNPPVKQAKFIGRSEVAAILDKDGGLHFWNVGIAAGTDNTVLLTGLEAIAVASDRDRLATLGRDGAVKLFELTNSNELREVADLGRNFTSFSLSKSGSALLGFGSEPHIVVFREGQKQTLAVDGRKIVAGHVSLDGSRVFLLEKGGDLTSWEMNSGTEVSRVRTDALRPRRPGFGLLEVIELQLKATKELETAQRDSQTPATKIKELQIALSTANQKRREFETDILGLPVPSLSLSGEMTKLIMNSDKLTTNKQPPLARVLPGPDSNAAIIITDDGYLNEVEVWDLASSQAVLSLRGLFSKIDVRNDGRSLAIVTPTQTALFELARSDKLQVTPSEDWSPERGPERLGEPVGVWHSPLGNYIATAHSPALEQQGAKASSASLWYAREVDSRDGDIHRGQRLLPTPARIVDFDFSARGDRVLSADMTGQVRTWKIAAEETLFGKNGGQMVAQFIFGGLRYTPEEGSRYLTSRFRTDDDLKNAARGVSRESLTSEQIERWELAPITSVDNLKTPSVEPPSYKWNVAVGFDEDSGSYDPTFIPELRQLMSDIIRKNPDDAEFGRRYATIVSTNPLLLSGFQIRWAKKILQDRIAVRYEDAVLVLAISGDRFAADILTSSSEAKAVRPEVWAWANAILTRQGRDTRWASASDPRSVQFQTFFTLPQSAIPFVKIEELKLDRSPEALVRAAAKYSGGSEVSSTLAPIAFALAVSGKPRSRIIETVGELARDSADLHRAEAFAFEAVNTNPSSVIAWNLLGNTKADSGRYPDAIAAFEKCLELGRVDGWPEFNMAVSYQKLERLDLAEAMYRRALTHLDTLRLKEDQGTFLNGLAWFLLTKRSSNASVLNEAYQLSRKSNELSNFNEYNFLDTHALAAFKLGRLQEAVTTQTKAVNLLKEDSKERGELAQRLREYETRLADAKTQR
ncbi:tetratricopeptide repeat protein [Tardiphaga sp. OK245]|uniref:tetratricopeptide repeat protein n=1 Tax=Tardiphaga sp. OK245 TaxID=1855306 RepID=UPI0008A7B5AD|nr:tetratricopeptide repeat protein [Tardiphaga sp. OK245]SEH40204.1 TPR repeat-containing protein [Tardiphaga sp. OK245]